MINTDLGRRQEWRAVKGFDNQFTLTFLQSGVAFDVSDYTFSVNIRKIGASDNEVELTESDGITNGGASGIVTILLNETESNIKAKGYFYEIVYSIGSFTNRLLQGTFNLVDDYNQDNTSTSLTLNVDLNGTDVRLNVTIGGGGSSVEAASQAEVNAGAVTDKYVSPRTLNQFMGLFYSVRVDFLGLVDGAEESAALQQIIDDNVGRIIIIPEGVTYLLRYALDIPSDTILEVNGTLKLIDANIRLLTSTISNGSTSCTVANASTYFEAGEMVCVSDDNQPINGGGAWKTRKVGKVNTILSVVGDTITFTEAFGGILGPGNFTPAANAKIANACGSIYINGKTNVIITGHGTIDGNQANRYNIAGAFASAVGGEQHQSNVGITFNNSSDCIVQGTGGKLNINNNVMHGISTTSEVGTITKRCLFDNIRFDGMIDKAIAGVSLHDSTISYCENLNGIDEGEIICYNNCKNVTITNCLSFNNRRYGIATTGQDNYNITVDNCVSVTGRNKPTTYNFYFQNQLYGTNVSNISCSSELMDSTWTRVTTTATVTTPVDHNLTNGQVIYVTYAASAPAIPVGSYTITVTSATTFTFTCVNSGSTSGNVSYVGMSTDGGIVINSCYDMDMKNVVIFDHPLVTSSFSCTATTAYAATSENIRVDGLKIKNSSRLSNIRGISIALTNKMFIENLSIDGVYRVFNDASGNGLVRFLKGSIINYTTLFETDNSKFIFSKIFGIVTENASSATIPSGSTSVTINHLMTRTPLAQNIKVTPTNSMGNSTKFWISAINANTFKINVDVDPGATIATFRWEIETYMGDVTTEPSYTTNYQSDFSVGTDSWATTNITLSGNNDGISDGTTSYNNTLKGYATATNSTHDISRASTVFVGKQNRVTIRYYIPTGQTNVNGFIIYANSFGTVVADLRSTLGVVGAWTEYTSAYFTPTVNTLVMRYFKTFTSSYAGAGSASDDIIYLEIVKVEYIP